MFSCVELIFVWASVLVQSVFRSVRVPLLLVRSANFGTCSSLSSPFCSSPFNRFATLPGKRRRRRFFACTSWESAIGEVIATDRMMILLKTRMGL